MILYKYVCLNSSLQIDLFQPPACIRFIDFHTTTTTALYLYSIVDNDISKLIYIIQNIIILMYGKTLNNIDLKF